jgi:UDP-glucose 4-epimerase
MLKIIVLGSNGYVGRHVVHVLHKKTDAELFLFDVQETSFTSHGKYRQLDLTNDLDEDVKHCFASADFIYIFSGLTGTHVSVEKYKNFVEVNELGLLKILDCLKRSSGSQPKIIFPSTRLVYKGIENTPIKEDDEKEFKTIYAINKYACEQYLEIYRNLYGIKYSVFRICVPYGNLLSKDLSYGTLSHFINKAKQGEDITLFGDGQLKRTFTHIEDVAEIVAIYGMDDRTNNQVFNIGSNDNRSLLEIANAIANIYKVKVKFIPFPSPDLAIESGDTIFDDTRFLQATNYVYKNLFSQWISNISKDDYQPLTSK